MKSKTLQLISRYNRILTEQDEDPNMQQPDISDPSMQQPEAPPEEAPLTSQGEDEYISSLVDAALFKPSVEEARTLLNLQNVIQMKRYTNAREEILPLVLSIISPETQAGDIKSDLDKI